MGRLRRAGHRGLRKLFEVGQRLGVDILPRHYYSSVPDVAGLRSTIGWRKPFEMCGVAGAELQGQIAFLRDLCPPELVAQWRTLDVHGAADRENGQGGGYGVIEAEILHAFVQRIRPRRIVQVGCGVSTAVILRAADLIGHTPAVTCVEPYPSSFLAEAEARGRIALHKQGAQECPREVLTSLEAGDLLFVDSTHAVRPGSEVNRIILDILPRLADGVFVHFHDIHFPFDYQRGVLSEELFFSAETSMLHAFLAGNARARIALSMSMLHHGAPDEIRRVLPHFDPQRSEDGLRADGGTHYPSSTYLLIGDIRG